MAPNSIIFPLSVAEGNFTIPYMPVLLNEHLHPTFRRCAPERAQTYARICGTAYH
ncbi:hypothetical protein K469DRAFT_701515 [Zopfia rhizophila CBS 207.26]|uniref:Uncharacterized protein n=1 Tax=Zopfia rhizophila CBS 207.26 TaxID=1314779 RepID=A0A6A6DB45_9PEZI|nr:hypothetical protein K469DRAFT_701515 [Zopfia rhizophila CBS 207.26]